MLHDNEKNRLWHMCQVSISMLNELMRQIEENDLKNEQTLREVIQELGALTGKSVSKDKEDKIISAVVNDKVPKDIDKFI